MQDVVFLMKQLLEWLLGTLGYRKCIECVSNSSGNVDIGPLKCFRKITYACFASHFQSRWERPGRWTWKKNLKELKGAFSYSAGWKVLFISTAGTHPSIDQWLSGGGGVWEGGVPIIIQPLLWSWIPSTNRPLVGVSLLAQEVAVFAVWCL